MAHTPTAGAPNSPSKSYFILAVTQTDTLLSMTLCRKPRPSIKISVLLWVLLNVLPPVRIASHCLTSCCLQNHMCLQFCTKNKLGSHQTLSYNKAKASINAKYSHCVSVFLVAFYSRIYSPQKLRHINNQGIFEKNTSLVLCPLQHRVGSHYGL